MNYKKMVNFKWDNGSIFPIYPNTSGSFASQRRINKLKPVAIAILTQEHLKIESAFKTLSKSRDHNVIVDLHLEWAIEKIKNARMSSEDSDLHGESDGETIWISKNKINDSELLGVLLHESLHYCCTFNGHDICTKDEHRVMRMLGDDC